MQTTFQRRKPRLSELSHLRGRWRQHPRYHGCIGHWLMVEGGGLLTYDLSGYGNHGVLTDMDPATDWILGPRGSALAFDGTAARVACGDVLQAPLGNSHRTITFWFLANTFATGTTDVLFEYAGTASAGIGERLQTYAEDGAISLTFNGHKTISPVSALSTGVWYHVAVRVPSGATTTAHVEVWLNGVQQTLATDAGSARTLNTVLRGKFIGGNSDANAGMDGRMDDVRIYTRALAPAEIFSLYADAEVEVAWAMQQTRRVWVVQLDVQLTGSFTSTTADCALTATGTVSLAATLARMLAPLSTMATSLLPLTGHVDTILGSLMSVGQGTTPITGASTRILDSATGSGRGAVGITGSSSHTVQATTLEALGTLSLQGHASQALDTMTTDGTGQVAIRGTLDGTLAPLQVAAGGALTVQGALGIMFDTLTVIAGTPVPSFLAGTVRGPASASAVHGVAAVGTILGQGDHN